MYIPYAWATPLPRLLLTNFYSCFKPFFLFCTLYLYLHWCVYQFTCQPSYPVRDQDFFIFDMCCDSWCLSYNRQLITLVELNWISDKWSSRLHLISLSVGKFMQQLLYSFNTHICSKVTFCNLVTFVLYSYNLFLKENSPLFGKHLHTTCSEKPQIGKYLGGEKRQKILNYITSAGIIYPTSLRHRFMGGINVGKNTLKTRALNNLTRQHLRTLTVLLGLLLLSSNLSMS